MSHYTAINKYSFLHDNFDGDVEICVQGDPDKQHITIPIDVLMEFIGQVMINRKIQQIEYSQIVEVWSETYKSSEHENRKYFK